MTFGEGIGPARLLVILYNDIASGNYGAAILTIIAVIAFFFLILAVGYLLRFLIGLMGKAKTRIRAKVTRKQKQV